MAQHPPDACEQNRKTCLTFRTYQKDGCSQQEFPPSCRHHVCVDLKLTSMGTRGKNELELQVLRGAQKSGLVRFGEAAKPAGEAARGEEARRSQMLQKRERGVAGREDSA